MFRRLLILLVLVGFSFSQLVSTCTNISSPGGYSVSANLVGNSSFGGVAACIYINSSNVMLFCKGYDISGNVASTSTRGIYVVGVSNVSISDCNNIDGYGNGIGLSLTQNSTIFNVTINGTYSDGIRSSDSSYNNFTLVMVYNTSGNGFHFTESRGNKMENCTAYNSSQNGVYLEQNSDSNTILNCTSFDNAQSGFRETEIDYSVYSRSFSYDNVQNGFYSFDSRFTQYLNNTAYLNKEYGIYVNTGSFCSLIDNHAIENGVGNTLDGIYVLTSENNTLISNLAANNTRHGIHLSASSLNNLTSNTANNNSEDGIRLFDSDYLNVSNNIAFNNSEDGMEVFDNRYNFVFNNSCYDNVRYGFNVDGDTLNNLFVNNTAFINTFSGWYIQGPDNNFTNNTASFNGVHGFRMDDRDLYFIDNYANNNTANGFYFNPAGSIADDIVMIRSAAWGNGQHGFQFSSDAAYINVSGSTAFSNGWSGFAFNSAFVNGRGLISYGNGFYGFHFAAPAENNTLDSALAYGNTRFAFYLENGAVDNNITSAMAIFKNFAYSSDQYLFQQATPARSNNLTNFTIAYNASTGLIAFQFLNITDLYLNSSNLLLNPSWASLNDSAAVQANKSANITLNGLSGQVAYYKAGFPQSRAQILTGTTYPTSISCAGPTCTFNVTGFSGYTLEDVQGCVNLSDSSTWGTKIVNESYNLNVNRNTTLCQDHYYLYYTGVPFQVMLEMNASGIYLDCNNSILDGVDKTDAGILAGTEYVTIENCTLTNYHVGMMVTPDSNFSRIAKNAAYNNSEAFQIGGPNNTIAENIAYNNSIGFLLEDALDQIVRDNKAYENSNGFRISGKFVTPARNVVYNNTAYNNTQRGFELDYDEFNTLVNNTAYLNGISGIRLSGSSNDSLSNNSVYNNTLYGMEVSYSQECNFTDNFAFGSMYGFYVKDLTTASNFRRNYAFNNSESGFYLNSSYYNVLRRNYAFNNSRHGFHLDADANHSTLDSNYAFNNSQYGYYIYYSSSGTFTNNSAFNNSQGFRFYNRSYFNTLTGNTAYENFGFGFSFAGDSSLNNLSNNVARDSLYVGFMFWATDNKITNNTAYNELGGFYIFNGSKYNVLENNTAYNTTYGFASNLTNGNTFITNDAFNNTYGFYSTRAPSDFFSGNRAYNNSQHGFYLEYSNRTAWTLNEGFNNSQAGFYFSDSWRGTIENNTAYLNQYGFVLANGADNNSLRNNTARDNTYAGFDISTDFNYLWFSNSTGNIVGFDLKGATDNIFFLTLASNNTGYGFSIDSSSVRNNFTWAAVYNQTRYLYQEPTGGQSNNFTNLVLAYDLNIGWIWYPNATLTAVDLNPSTVITDPYFVSLNDTNPDALQANLTANITVYADNCLFVLKRTGYPTTRAEIVSLGKIYSAPLTCVGSGPAKASFIVPGFSGYAVDDYTGCVNLSDPTTWAGRVENDTATGILMVNKNTTLCQDHYYLDTSSQALEMNSSNIYLDCNFSIIDGVDDTGRGIYAYQKENFTIINCTVQNYLEGILVRESVSAMVLSDTATSNDFWGIFLWDSNNSFVQYNNVSGNANNGIMLQNSHYNNVRYNNVSSNGNWRGIGLLASSSYNNISHNNVSGHVNYAGIDLANVNNNLISYNDIGSNYYGIYASYSDSNTILWDEMHDNGAPGLYMEYSNHSVVANNTWVRDYIGFSIYYSHNGIFSNNVVHDSDDQGIRFYGSSGNNLTDTLAYSNGNWALMIMSNAINQFTNTFVYNQTAYMYVVTDSPTNFTNLTLGYNATVGLVNYPSMNTTANTMPQEIANVYIQPDWVSIDAAEANIGQAVSAAFITINNSNCAGLGVLKDTGFPSSYSEIITDGLHYPTTKTCNGDLATFYVTGFSGYTLGQETTYLDFSINESSPITYGTSINASCEASNPEVLLNLYANDTLLDQGYGYIEFVGLLAAGSYNITCNTSGDENYTAAEESALFQINRAAPAVTFTADPSWSIRPGDTVNISCSTSNPQITLELWNSTGMVGSGSYIEQVGAFAAGSYDFTCNSTETENYTAFSQTQTLNVRTPSEGGAPEEIQLFIIAPDEVPQGSEMALVVQKEGGALMPGARVVIKFGATTVFDGYTDPWGRVFFTPTSTGTYEVTATKTDFLPAKDSFTAYAPSGAITATLQSSCEGSVVTVTQEVCTGGELDAGGYLECMEVPVEGASVSIYRCEEGWETAGDLADACTDLIGTYVTDADGRATTYERDGHVRIVVSLPIATHFVGTTIDGELQQSVQCPLEQVSIDFDPACEGSTVTLTGEICTAQALATHAAPPVCEPGPLSGMRVEIYCCPVDYDQMDLRPQDSCKLIDAGSTDAAGMFVTDSKDCDGQAVVFVPRVLDTRTGDTIQFVQLPTTEGCPECLSDQDCPEGFVCREGQCTQEELPPDQRRCSSDAQCTHGYRCSGERCTEIISCAANADCPAGQGCLEGICYTNEEIEAITGGEGGVEPGGGLPAVLQSVFNVVVTYAWLILIILVLLFLLFFLWRRKKKKKPLTQEELIAREEEMGRKPAPPRPPRTR